VRIGHHGSQDPVYGITTAEQSHTDDISRRQKQYILTMLVRVVSIVVVVCVPGISWQIKILLCLVATVIPYIAVVRANGGPAQEKDPTNLLLAPPGKQALGSEQPGLPSGGRVVDGEADETPDSGGDGDGDGETARTAESAETEGAPNTGGTGEATVAHGVDGQREEPEPAARAARTTSRG
jgi:hypothetical protein